MPAAAFDAVYARRPRQRLTIDCAFEPGTLNQRSTEEPCRCTYLWTVALVALLLFSTYETTRRSMMRAVALVVVTTTTAVEPDSPRSKTNESAT
jgi:hypothetical protein